MPSHVTSREGKQRSKKGGTEDAVWGPETSQDCIDLLTFGGQFIHVFLRLLVKTGLLIRKTETETVNPSQKKTPSRSRLTCTEGRGPQTQKSMMDGRPLNEDTKVIQHNTWAQTQKKFDRRGRVSL